MSRTISVGVVGAKHWLYPAAVMEMRLDQIIKGQKIKIPLGVLHDAQLFFKVVLGRKTGSHFDNGPAQLNAPVIAWNVLNNCPDLRTHTRKEADGHFRRFAKFLESLESQPTVPLNEGFAKQPSVPLGEEDQKTANDLRDFFAALVKKAEREDRH